MSESVIEQLDGTSELHEQMHEHGYTYATLDGELTLEMPDNGYFIGWQDGKDDMFYVRLSDSACTGYHVRTDINELGRVR